ncbi:MAG: hypothetical protein F6K14_34625 [Symploca sp. SIO2C1]|nr:hypothetical protein [Symploca sp. SIO2C1]
MSNEGRNFCQILLPWSPLFPSKEGLGVGYALEPSALFIESHCKFRSPIPNLMENQP